MFSIFTSLKIFIVKIVAGNKVLSSYRVVF